MAMKIMPKVRFIEGVQIPELGLVKLYPAASDPAFLEVIYEKAVKDPSVATQHMLISLEQQFTEFEALLADHRELEGCRQVTQQLFRSLLLKLGFKVEDRVAEPKSTPTSAAPPPAAPTTPHHASPAPTPAPVVKEQKGWSWGTVLYIVLQFAAVVFIGVVVFGGVFLLGMAYNEHVHSQSVSTSAVSTAPAPVVKTVVAPSDELVTCTDQRNLLKSVCGDLISPMCEKLRPAGKCDGDCEKLCAMYPGK